MRTTTARNSPIIKFRYARKKKHKKSRSSLIPHIIGTVFHQIRCKINTFFTNTQIYSPKKCKN